MHQSRATLSFEEFEELLTVQLDLIYNLHKLVSRQEAIFRSGRVEEIASLNHAKCALLMAVRPNIGTLREMHERWQELRDQLQPWQCQCIEQRVQELRRAVEEVLQKEKQSEKLVMQARSEMNAAINGQWNTSVARLVESL